MDRMRTAAYVARLGMPILIGVVAATLPLGSVAVLIFLWGGLEYWESRLSALDRYASIEAQLKLLMELTAFGTNHRVRCTYHVPAMKRRPILARTDPSPRNATEHLKKRRLLGFTLGFASIEGYRQVTNYVPEPGKKPGRWFDASNGIVGYALREKLAFAESFDSLSDYRQGMIGKYGYDPQELKEASSDRRSFLSIPILDGAIRLHGIVYLDSSRPQTFHLDKDNRANSDRRTQMVLRACDVLARSV